MDVLQVIKDDHNSLKLLAEELVTAATIKGKKSAFEKLEPRLANHLRIEEDFVYPEAEETLNVPESFFNISRKNQKLLRRLSTQVKKVLSTGGAEAKNNNRFSELTEALLNHNMLEESVLMPRMRKDLPTQEREDLGMIYRDLMSEPINHTKALGRSKAQRQAL